ncbi:MAG: GNAT family N-acetyltransferase [Acidimicrobiales bacterium]
MSFRPFERDEIEAYHASMLARFTAELEASGMSKEQARSHAGQSDSLVFPGGKLAEGHYVGHVVVDGDDVGALWLGPAEGEVDRWWIYYVEIDEEKRGRGLGREAMLLAESVARDHGATTLGLNVFGDNDIARSLYRSLGYGEVSIQMRKPL